MKNIKNFGIWIDKRKAVIIEMMASGEHKFTLVKSEVEEFHPVGGARSGLAWGPMDSVSESKFLEREKQQLKRYFKEIVKGISSPAQLYIFGPAEAKVGLRQYLNEHKNPQLELLGYETADSMTENQMIARVREFYKQN